MQFDFLSLLKDYNIPHTQEHHHCTPGWVNVHCPHCIGRPNFHLGIHLETGVCNCWRCGTHSLFSTLSKLLSVSPKQVAKILLEYAHEGIAPRTRRKKYETGRTEAKLPITTPLQDSHRKYLESRNFDVEELIQVWNICSTGPVGSYKHRIFIPIEMNRKIVSFQARTIHKHVKPRYKTCAKEDEAIHHKYIFYGMDYTKSKKSVIIVEGVTDVWRIGPGAQASFGITYTLSQVLLCMQYDKVYIMFDDEKNAQKQARKFAAEIEVAAGNEVYLIDKYGKDPGELSPDQVAKLRELVG